MPVPFNLSAQPPKADKRPVTTEQLGRSRTDDYHWLKDPNWQQVMTDPSVLDADIRRFLEDENAYTQQVMAPLADLTSSLFEDMKSRIDPKDEQVPVTDGPYAYFHAFREGDQHGYFGRKPVSSDKSPIGETEIILDVDDLATQSDGYFDLGAVKHSPDHSALAYGEDRAGSENYEIFVKRLSGSTVSTGITRSAGGLVWAADSQTLFWVERDDNKRPSRVFAKNVFDPKAEPRLVYEEHNPGFFVSIGKTQSGRFILIDCHDHTTSEVWTIPADTPTTNPVCFSERMTGREYSIHDHGDYFYVHTNADGATDFKVMRARMDQPGSAWEPFIAHEPGTLILDVETYASHMVRLERKDALPRITIRDMSNGTEQDVKFDEAAYGLGLPGMLEYETDWLRIAFSSPKTPERIFDLNLKTGERVTRKVQNVPSGHDPDDYTTERLHLPARDGETVPVTLVYRHDTSLGPETPLLLYGYGSYGITIPADFSTSILSLVDRGFVFAKAHIRGGKSKGYQWYLDGKLEKKVNTFNDFVDVGRELATRGYTSRGKIVAHGGSAGGLLVGAALNQDPSLFGAVIAAVPFVDVLNTMSDDTLPLTPPEWPEWGNPLEDENAYDQIAAYSPYDNVVKADYPPLFISGGLTDPRVTYWEPAKWAAKLRDHQTGTAPILLKINMEAGHAGESGRYDRLKERAEEYAFAIAAVEES